MAMRRLNLLSEENMMCEWILVLCVLYYEVSPVLH